MFLFALMAKDISRSLSLPIIFCMPYLLTLCELHFLFPQKYDYGREKKKTCGKDFDILSTNAVKMTQCILGKASSQKDIALLKIPVFILDSFSCQLAKKDQTVEGGMMCLCKDYQNHSSSLRFPKEQQRQLFLFVLLLIFVCSVSAFFTWKWNSSANREFFFRIRMFFFLCVCVCIRACRFRLWRVWFTCQRFCPWAVFFPTCI